MRVVATAGHVDHGKSTVVHALTGIDPDRLEEEKRRGLTIDLGFAHTTLPSGEDISFIDVPGHVRFVANMLAGVGAVDACLFIVAATEGWKPQSEEHLRILELLGIGHGLIALTKVDGVDDDDRELARLDIMERTNGTFLAGCDVVEVAAPTGFGLDELRQALDRLVAVTPAASDRGRPRLWIDRSFAAKGSGTVVTGTLTGGKLAVDDVIDIVPLGRSARIRAIQTTGRTVDRIGPGHRVAVNLVGIEHTGPSRGDALVHGEQWRPTKTFDASLDVLASLDHDVSRRGAFVAHMGAGEWPVRVRVLGRDVLAPGHRGAVRLHLPVAVPLVAGDRFVLRESGRAETVGGGEVLDVAPVLRASRARPDRSVDRVIAERGAVLASDLEALTGERRPPNLGPFVAAPDRLAALLTETREAIDAAGSVGLDLAACDDLHRLALDLLDEAEVMGGRARRRVSIDPLADHPYIAALAAGRLAPPGPDGVDRAELRELVRRGYVVERDGVWFHPAAVAEATSRLAPILRSNEGGITASQAREAFGVSRKYALPLLGELDARGITRRRGDLRVAGPRLPPD